MKKVNLSVTMSYVISNVEPLRYCSLVIMDKASGLTLVDATVEPEAFYSMMSGLGRTECYGKVYDNYANAGLNHEFKEFEITDARLNDRSVELDDIISEYTHVWEPDGWVARSHTRGTLSQGQLNNDTLRVKTDRYVED